MNKIITILVLLMVLGSCTSTQGPGPVNPHEEEEAERETMRKEPEPSVSSLNALVKDEELLFLMTQVQRNNHDLHSRSFNLQAESHLLKQNLAALLPNLNLELTAGRNNLAVNAISNEEETVNSFRGGLNLDWELDIWGRAVDGQRALGRKLKASEIALEQERRSLTAGIVRVRIEQAAQQMSLRVEEKRMELLDRTGLIIEERFRSGIASIDDLAYTKARRAVAEANLLQRRAGLHQLHSRMDLLLGRKLSAELSVPEELPEVSCPLVSAEKDLLGGRPDVRQALKALEAARFARREGFKDFLPSLSLGAQVYKKAEDADKLGSSDMKWLVQGALNVPLYAGGRRYHSFMEKDARTSAALSDLEGCRNRALSEIELGIRNESEYLKLLEALTRAHEESDKILGVAERRYLKGLAGIENYLNAQDDLLSYKLRIIEQRASLYINRINLALSLGWDTGVEIEP